jgi:ribosomal protein S18 acetylase RimI-like enzyme
MEIRGIRAGEIEATREFLAANGWAQRVADAHAFHTLIANSQRNAVAVDDGRIVGFARALCDGVSNGYLSMVTVAPAYRRRGVGRNLVHHIIGDDPNITWVARAGRAASVPFFEKLGFSASTYAMERNRSA